MIHRGKVVPLMNVGWLQRRQRPSLKLCADVQKFKVKTYFSLSLCMSDVYEAICRAEQTMGIGPRGSSLTILTASTSNSEHKVFTLAKTLPARQI